MKKKKLLVVAEKQSDLEVIRQKRHTVFTSAGYDVEYCLVDQLYGGSEFDALWVNEKKPQKVIGGWEWGSSSSCCSGAALRSLMKSKKPNV